MRISDEYIMRKIANQCVVVPVGGKASETKGVFALNETAEVIWSSIKQGKSVDDIVEMLCSEYEVSVEEAKECVISMIEGLRQEGIIDE